MSGDPEPTPRGARAAYWIILGISVLNLLFVIGTMLWFIPVPVFGVSMIYKIVLGVGVLSAALTVGALIYSVLGWKRGYWGIYARVHYTRAEHACITRWRRSRDSLLCGS